jgi:hypothetical protein
MTKRQQKRELQRFSVCRPEPQVKELVTPRPFMEFTLSEAEGFRAAAGGRLRGAMRPLAVLSSSALWMSRTLIGNLL